MALNVFGAVGYLKIEPRIAKAISRHDLKVRAV